MHQYASRRPESDEYALDYHRDLIGRVSGDCVVKVLKSQTFWMCELAGSISTEQVDRIHAPYHWSIRQVFEHCTNTERLFGYRIMCLADGSEPSLPGWDENVSADSRFGLGNFSRLVEELGNLRNANLSLLARLVPAAWNHPGVVEGNHVTVRSLAWILAGHLQHHFEIVEKRCDVTALRQPPRVD